MSSQRPTARTSCRRCQLKKTRCNKVDPRCDKCEAAGAECIYVPRKARPRRRWGVDDQDVLTGILRRLDRLENHCGLDHLRDDYTHAARSMSVSSASSGIEYPVPEGANQLHGGGYFDPTGTIPEIWNQINNPATRPQALSGIFCHLKPLETHVLQSEVCANSINAVVEDLVFTDCTPSGGPALEHPVIPRDVARKWIHKYHECHQFDGLSTHLDKHFLLALPDLLGTRHVRIDYTAQIIYYNVLLHGNMLDSAELLTKSQIVNQLSELCINMGESWVGLAGNTAADMSAACIMVSLALEEGHFELAWKSLGHACFVARSLGYFFVDGNNPGTPNEQPRQTNGEAEVDMNRKRFEFWHLLRMDCMFRLSFGKPALIPAGSWAVNFPDPTINGDDNPEMHFVQIHFLASMRLTLVMLKYLDYIEGLEDPEALMDEKFGSDLAMEVHTIIETWNPDQLLNMTTNHVDSWFAVDILLGCYKLLIIISLRTDSYQYNGRLPEACVCLARRSLETFRTFMGSTSHAHWGISLTLLHQFIPLLIVCTDLIQSHNWLEDNPDIELVDWMKRFVERTAQKRVNLRPVMDIMKVITLACEKGQ